ncbi:MAG: NTP transferase domain-containing protein [Sulfuritalea sp.]|nr:NTP transferase domain-containing protein [Sulfuritalea sp.]
MNPLPTVVISAAGRGTRMGQPRPKCLIPILGKPLIHWQLEAIQVFPRLIVAVGFHAEEVIATVRAIRPDAEFVVNHEYETTGTASSLSIALAHGGHPAISVDGDLLVHPADLLSLASGPVPSIGVCDIQSLAPVLTSIQNANNGDLQATSFHHGETMDSTSGMLEWTGLVTIDPRAHPVKGNGHVYQMILPLLPCRAVHVRCREIDYPAEVPLMEAWLQPLIGEGVFRG